MYKIYHNPRCKKSRAGLKYLEENGFAFEIIKYLDTPLLEKELRDLLLMLNTKPIDLLRTQEVEYKQLIKGKSLSEEELIQMILTYPNLMKRPIVVHNKKAIWADPALKIQDI